jgi:hypothetical protein
VYVHIVTQKLCFDFLFGNVILVKYPISTVLTLDWKFLSPVFSTISSFIFIQLIHCLCDVDAFVGRWAVISESVMRIVLFPII